LAAGAQLLLPADSPFSIIGHSSRDSSPQIHVSPADSEDADPAPKASEIDAPSDPAAVERAEAEARAREAELIRAERANREKKGAPTERSGPQPEPQPIQTGRQAPLDAERQRRIDALKAIKHPPNQTLGNARPGSRRLAKGPTKKLDEVSKKLMQDRRGLYAKYYAFNDNPFAVLMNPAEPLLEARTPAVTRIDRHVHFPSKEAWSDLHALLSEPMLEPEDGREEAELPGVL
jgi:hypothetical protein